MRLKLVIFLCFCFILHRCVIAQWVPLNGGPTDMGTFAASGSAIFATVSSGIIMSTDNGLTWSVCNSGFPPNTGVNSLATLGNTVFAATSDGVYKTTNNGINWNKSNNGLELYGASVFFVSGNVIYAGSYINTDSGRVYKSTNNGANWMPLGNFGHGVSSLAVSGENVFACSIGTGIFMTTNNGQNWYPVNNGLTNLYIWTMTSIGTTVFAGSPDYPVGGVYRSTNTGVSWELINDGLINHDIRSFAVSENILFAGTAGGVFMTTNYGTNWVNRNQGFSLLPAVFGMLVTNNYIYAGIYQNRTYRRTLSDILYAGQNGNEFIKDFTLSQNYPNPFNPFTRIKFEIPNNSFVTLKVFDILGRETAVILSENMKAGSYDVPFDASNLTSGVYFYKITAGDFSSIRKMLLIK